MARLEDILPPGEIVRWRSPKVIRPRRLLGRGAAYLVLAVALLLLYARAIDSEQAFYVSVVAAILGLLWLLGELSASASEVAVTEGHLVWVHPGLLFRLPPGIRRLHDIRAVDLEDGEALVNLYCDGDKTTFELPRDADAEAMARAIGRPARLWRKSDSRMAKHAWRWQEYSYITGVFAALLPAAGVFGLAHLLFDLGAMRGTAGQVVGLTSVVSFALLVTWGGELGEHILPHFLIGRRLAGADRLDFVGALTDLRWQGLNPHGRGDRTKLRSRLAEWAMRTAYGEIPDLSGYGPEILIPGEFPAE